MTLAYLVYLGLLVMLTTCWAVTARAAYHHPARDQVLGIQAMSFTIIAFTLLIGCRYAVGGDFYGYIYYYQSTYPSDSPSDVVFEPGFFYLIQLLKFFNAPDRSIIIASSFVQIFLLSYWLKDKKFVAPFVVYFFITIVLLEFNNTIRQGIAIIAMMLALDCINRRNIVKFLFWAIFAYMFHRSALIIIPLGVALWYFRVPSVYAQLALLFFSYSSVGVFYDQVISIFSRLSPLFGYEGYSDINRADLVFGGGQESLNVGRYLWPVVDTAVILYSRKLSDYYDNYGYRLYHLLFLIAALLQPVALAWNFLPFGRALFYFTAMRMVCLGFLARYCLVESGRTRDVIVGLGLCLVFAIWLIVAVSRGAATSAPYSF